jgi:ketosteroid isomerase-like protein
MTPQHADLIKKAYAAFNARDIDKVLSTMQTDVHWPNAWEGGYVTGYDAIRQYWTRQWKELNPVVEPTGFTERPDGRVEVAVHQTVKDMEDNLVFDGVVKHVYSFKDGLISGMDVEKM